MPKINLYRNISVFFIVFAVMLICAVILLFYSQATIIVYAGKQDVNLSFRAEVKSSTTVEDLALSDVVSGSIITDIRHVSGTFSVLSTKTGNSDIVGRVRIINTSNKNQPLVKTTQLQAKSGVIVRTAAAAVVPAAGNVEVGVYPKDPAAFSAIETGQKLIIIKLNPALQDKIYGTALEKLSAGPRQVKVVSDSDINRAKADLKEKFLGDLRQELNLSPSDYLDAELISYQTDKKVGAEADSFTLNGDFRIKRLDLDKQQLAGLIARKVQQMNLPGLVDSSVDLAKVKYSLADSLASGNLAVKVEYPVTVTLSPGSEAIAKSNFAGKTAEEIQSYAQSTDLIKNVEVYISPYWQKTVPQQENRIRLIIRQ